MRTNLLLISLFILVFLGGFSAVLYFPERLNFQVWTTDEKAPVEEKKGLQSSKKIPSVKAVAEVREAQELLTALGYDPGPIDGVEGTTTRSALREFQRDNGISSDGKIDGAILSRLKEAKRINNSKQKNILKTNSRSTAVQPYELKGDRLGMSLTDFEYKYSDRDPHCRSDVVAYFKIANVLTCTVRRGPRTIAGVETSVFRHNFVDEKLFLISAVFPHDEYSEVRDTLIAKYGKPSSANRHTFQNRIGANFVGESLRWINAVSEIFLSEFADDFEESRLHFIHHELWAVVEKRQPGSAVDKL